MHTLKALHMCHWSGKLQLCILWLLKVRLMHVACACECIHPYNPECAGEKGAMDSFPARLRKLSLALSNYNNIDSWMKNSNHISEVFFCGDNESGIVLLYTVIFEYSFSTF